MQLNPRSIFTDQVRPPMLVLTHAPLLQVGVPHSLKGEAIYVFVTLMHGLEMTPALQKELKQVGLALRYRSPSAIIANCRHLLPTAGIDRPLPTAIARYRQQLPVADSDCPLCDCRFSIAQERLLRTDTGRFRNSIHTDVLPFVSIDARQTVRKEIGAFAVPDTVHWAPGLPKTRSGDYTSSPHTPSCPAAPLPVSRASLPVPTRF